MVKRTTPAAYIESDLEGEGAVVIYVVQAGDDGPVKIGMTTDMRTRMKSLQSQSPVPIHLRFVTLGDAKLEKELHEGFAEWRMHGEWFHSHPDLWALLKMLPKLNLDIFTREQIDRRKTDPNARMAAAQAEMLWRDHNLTAKQALAMMWGWNYQAARTAFGNKPGDAGRKIGRREAVKRGKKGGAAMIARSQRTRWDAPEIQKIKRELSDVWRSKNYRNDTEAAEAVNAYLADREMPIMGSWPTVRRVLGKRTG